MEKENNQLMKIDNSKNDNLVLQWRTGVSITKSGLRSLIVLQMKTKVEEIFRIKKYLNNEDYCCKEPLYDRMKDFILQSDKTINDRHFSSLWIANNFKIPKEAFEKKIRSLRCVAKKRIKNKFCGKRRN